MRKVAVCFLYFLLLLTQPVKAFELVPMVATFSDKGRQTESFFQINNTSNVPLPVEIFVKKRLVEGSGSEKLEDTEDFFIFPPQALVPAGKTQVVKVKYIGNPISQASSYRIVFSQLPIKDSVEQSSIKMLFQIGALVFVSPENVNYSLDARVLNTDSQVKKMTLVNTGSGVLALPELSFEVHSEGDVVKWSWEQLQSVLDRQFLVPGEEVSVPIESLTSGLKGKLAIEVKGL